MLIRPSKPDLHAAALPWVLTLAVAGACIGDAQGSGPHVHGLARLLLAYEEGTLELQLTSPAESLVGFEHPPGNAEEASAVAGAEAILRDPARVFRLEGAFASWMRCNSRTPLPMPPMNTAPRTGRGTVITPKKVTATQNMKTQAMMTTMTTMTTTTMNMNMTNTIMKQHPRTPISSPSIGLSVKAAKHRAASEIVLFEHFPRLERVTLEWLLPESSGSSDLVPDMPRQVLD